MASKDTCPALMPIMGDTEILSDLENALERAGGESYSLLSENEKTKLFKNLDRKFIKKEEIDFIPSKIYEETNNLDTKFQVGGDHTGSDSNEQQMSGSAEGSTNGCVMAASTNISASKQIKSSSECVTRSQPLPAKSSLRRETGYYTYSCTFKVSLRNDCTVRFTKWRNLHWLYFWLWGSSSIDPGNLVDSVNVNGYIKTVSGQHVLSKLNGWNKEDKAATITFYTIVEGDRNKTYELDEFGKIKSESIWRKTI